MNARSLGCVALLIAMGKMAGGAELLLSEFKAEDERITEIIRNLALAFKTRICVEEAENDLPPLEVEGRLQFQFVRYTVSAKNASVGDVLDKIAGVAPAYAWSYDEATETYNIYPKENAPLSWEIDGLSAHNKTVDEVLTTVMPEFRRHRIGFWVGFGKLEWLKTRISFVTRSTKARQMLNLICRELGAVQYVVNWVPQSKVKGMVYFFPYFGRRAIVPPAVHPKGASSPETEPRTRAERETEPSPHGGPRATLSSDKDTYGWGETPVFTLSLRNTSEMPVKVRVKAPMPYTRLENHYFGTVVRCTVPRALHDRHQGTMLGYTYRTVTLRPGDHICCRSFNVPKYYHAGTYRFIGFFDGTLSRQESEEGLWNGVAVSDPITIRVEGRRPRRGVHQGSQPNQRVLVPR